MRDSQENTHFCNPWQVKIVQTLAVTVPASTMTFVLVQPLEVLKIKTQATAKCPWQLGYHYLKGGHIKPFYQAGGISYFKFLAKGAYRNPTYGALSAEFQCAFPEQYKTQAALTALSMAGIDNIIVCPLERLKVLMITKENNNGLSQFFTQKRAVGQLSLIRDLYKGFNLSMTKAVVSWQSFLVTESAIRMEVLEYKKNKQEKAELSLVEKSIVGWFSGVVNALFTFPFDTIKTNLQKEGVSDAASFTNIVKTSRSLLATRGFFKGFYGGFQLQLMQYMMLGVITSHVIHEVNAIWQPDSAPSLKRM